MKTDQSKRITDLLILGIIFVGALFRIWDFWDWSFTNDELSALNRLDYNSFSELIEKGIWVDGHPALVQIFLFYWSKLAGTSALAIRLPFVVLSIGTLYYFKQLAQQWLNKSASIVALSIFAVSQLFVLYGQIARPYVVGLFFTIAFGHYWLKLTRNTFEKKDLFLFLLMGFCCSLSHYFSGLSLAIFLVIGIFKVNKKRLFLYLSLCLALAIFFLPHLTITLNHFSIGGVGWLPIPKVDFFVDFISFLFNNSIWFTLAVLSIFIVGIFLKMLKFPQKDQWILPLLFLAPYLIAYFYSIHKSPVLQNSVLIFCSPFFILFLASFIKEKIAIRSLLVSCILIIATGSYSLVIEQDFYSKKNFANFKTVAEKSVQWTDEFGKENVLRISNTNDPAYLDYYLSKKDSSFNFHISRFDSLEVIAQARDLIMSTKANYVLIAFANVPVPAEVHEYTKEYFPSIEKKERFFNSEAILYKKGKKKRNHSLNISKTSPDTTSYFLSSETEYALTHKDSVGGLWTSKNKYLTISAKLKSLKEENIILTVSIHRDNETIFWRGFDTKPYYSSLNEWNNFKCVLPLPGEAKSSDLVKIFFWNPDHRELFIEDFEIANFDDSDYNYYDF